jgi:hypothetical protein
LTRRPRPHSKPASRRPPIPPGPFPAGQPPQRTGSPGAQQRPRREFGLAVALRRLTRSAGVSVAAGGLLGDVRVWARRSRAWTDGSVADPPRPLNGRLYPRPARLAVTGPSARHRGCQLLSTLQPRAGHNGELGRPPSGGCQGDWNGYRTNCGMARLRPRRCAPNARCELSFPASVVNTSTGWRVVFTCGGRNHLGHLSHVRL